MKAKKDRRLVLEEVRAALLRTESSAVKKCLILGEPGYLEPSGRSMAILAQPIGVGERNITISGW